MFRSAPGRRFNDSNPRHPSRRPCAARPWLEGLEDRALLSMTLHHDSINPSRNGSVIVNVQVENVFWGADYADPTKLQSAAIQLDTFMKYLVDSPFMDTLAQYGVEHGTYQGSTTLVDETTTGTVTPQQIRDAIGGQIAAGKLPAWGPSQLFMVYLPPGVSIGSAGYHSDQYNFSAIPDPATGLLKYNDFIFAAVASSATNPVNTVVASHELAEAATAPRFDSWFDDAARQTNGGEVADLATPNTGTLNGYLVTQLWSNSDNRIVVPGSTPRTSPPPGGLPNSTTATSAQVSLPTPTPTPTPTPSPTIAPVFLGETRVTRVAGKRRKVTTVFQLNFSGPLDVGTAQTTLLYQVQQVTGKGKRGARPKRVAVTSAVYNSDNHSVTLRLGKFAKNQPLLLSATGLLGVDAAPVAAIKTRL